MCLCWLFLVQVRHWFVWTCLCVRVCDLLLQSGHPKTQHPLFLSQWVNKSIWGYSFFFLLHFFPSLLLQWTWCVLVSVCECVCFSTWSYLWDKSLRWPNKEEHKSERFIVRQLCPFYQQIMSLKAKTCSFTFFVHMTQKNILFSTATKHPYIF